MKTNRISKSEMDGARETVESFINIPRNNVINFWWKKITWATKLCD